MYSTLTQIFLFCFVVLIPTTGVLAQDTMNVTIPDIYITEEDEGEVIAIPVYIDYPGLISSFLFSLSWDEEQFGFDTIQFGTAILDETYVYGMPVENEVRVLVSSPGEHDLHFRDDSLAFTVYFDVRKFSGRAILTFNNDILVGASDDNRVRIPINFNSGTITYNDQVVRTYFDNPVSGEAPGQICTGLYSRGTAPLLGFDFALEWETDEFVLDSVILGDNPLGLVPEEITAAPDLLAFRRDTLARDTTPPLPFGTRLFDLCFTPQALRANSSLALTGRDSTPSFQVLREDTTVVNAPYDLRRGRIFLPDEVLNDVIRLSAVATSPSVPDDTVNCVTIMADNFIEVSAFDFIVRWPDNLRLETVGYPQTGTGLDTTSLRSQTTTSARVAYTPDSLVNITLPAGTPLLELCFSGELSPCDFTRIELEAQPFSSYFHRQIFDFTEGAPLPFQLVSGYLSPFQQDTLILELEWATSDPDNQIHEVKLSAINGRCFTSYAFELTYDFRDLLLLSESIATERLAGEHLLDPGTPFEVTDLTPATPAFFPAGDLATFRFVRRSERDTVPILLAHGDADFATLLTPNGDTLAIPVLLRSGGILFREDSITGTRAVANNDGNHLSVFPNPTDGQFTVELPEPPLASDEIVMVNLLGQEVLRSPLNRQQTDFELRGPAGVYFYTIRRQGRILAVGRLTVN